MKKAPTVDTMRWMEVWPRFDENYPYDNIEKTIQNVFFLMIRAY